MGQVAVVTRGLVLLVAFILVTALTSHAQESGTTPSKDVIFARKMLMGSIDMQMDEIETMLAPNAALNLSEGQEHADIISIMLMSFPHLFPLNTDQWMTTVDRDPATDTYASPEVWKNFADFYTRATAASKLALDASKARRGEDFRELIEQLRVACNSCHGLYLKTD